MRNRISSSRNILIRSSERSSLSEACSRKGKMIPTSWVFPPQGHIRLHGKLPSPKVHASHFEMKRKPSQHTVFCTDCLPAFGGAPVSPVNHSSVHSVTIVFCLKEGIPLGGGVATPLGKVTSSCLLAFCLARSVPTKP